MKILDGIKLEEKILEITDITKKVALKDLLAALQESELVTCENCIYCMRPQMFGDKKWHCSYYNDFVPPDFYCARGE